MSIDPDRETSAIVEDLSSADEEIRRLAVERLSELPAREAVPHLVDRLGDSSWRVRKAAVARLVGSSADLVADALIAALADGENPGRRNSAVEALVACGSAMVSRLVESLETDDRDVRKMIVDALAGIGDVAARPQMIDRLQDADPNVRASAADALGVLAGDEAAEALREVAGSDDEDRLVRFSALRSLSRVEASVPSSELSGLLTDSVLRPAAFALLGYSDDAGAEEQLLKGLSVASRASREAAIEALLVRLGRLDGQATETLARRVRETVASTEGLLEGTVERLADGDLSIRLMLVQFLGLVGSEACVVPVLEAAGDEAIAEVALSTLEALGDVSEKALTTAWPDMDRVMRCRACALLARTGGSRADARLQEALDDPDAELRTAAARALGARSAEACLPDLLRCLEAAALDDEPESEDEVDALVEAIVALSSSRAGIVGQTVAGLAGRLESPVEPVRLAAAAVLTQIARSEDSERVTALLRDPAAGVRRLAVAGLTRLPPATAAHPLRLALADESPLVRVAAATALGAASVEGILDDLQRLLADEDARVASAAVRAIGEHCSGRKVLRGGERDRALKLLAASLSGETRGTVALAAIAALDAMGGASAASAAALGLQSEEPEIVRAAVGCVGRHADSEGLSALIPVVQHASWAVRGDVIETLAERRVPTALPAILRRLETEQDSFVRDVIVRALRRLEEGV